MLYGLCTSIEKMALDPLPVTVPGRVVVDLTGSGRENVLRNLLGVNRLPFANQVEQARENGEERGG
ncbi:MAG TPA: hypothetical protein VI027_07770 [Rubrobacteraceae bacterium]